MGKSDRLLQNKNNGIGEMNKDMQGGPDLSRFRCAILAILLRLLALYFLREFFENSPELATPWNSFKRFKEGIFLWNSPTVHDVYDGDRFHVMPIFVYLFVHFPILAYPIFIRFLWAMFDLFSAYFLGEFVRLYILEFNTEKDARTIANRLAKLAFAGYLLNPMQIGCWTVSSLSVLLNALLAASLFFTLKGNVILAVLLIALAIQLNPYYFILFAPIFIRFQGRSKLIAIFSSFVFSMALFALNFSMVQNPRKLFDSTLGFFLTVPDLSPNVGLFWYFFIQVFDHYRKFFLSVFQLNSLIYVIPFSMLLRKNLYLLWVLLMIQVALFTPYPSYAESTLYLPMIAAFFELHKYIRYSLILGCTFAVTSLLMPVMWRMWIVTASGNANFYFAIALTFSIAQIFVSIDLVSAYLRSNLIREHGGDEEVERKFEGIKLVHVFPFPSQE